MQDTNKIKSKAVNKLGLKDFTS
jgi:hypothetical protein